MFLLFVGTNASIAADILKNSDCLECHSDKTLMTTNAAQKVVSLFFDEDRFIKSAHRTNSCVSCHDDLTSKHPDDNLVARPVNCAKCHEPQSTSYGASVHGIALKAGKPGSATCVDCHGTHEVLPPSSPESPLHFSKLDQTCGQCHDDAARAVATSVHGQATAKGSRESATCTDCHSEHKIETLKGVSSLVLSQQICSKCHASERMNTKYNLPKDRVTTFFASYHGLAARYGSTLAANCGSCHGVHKILRSSDPNSTINKAHLAETCGKCHPGATDKFSQSKVHIDVASAKAGDTGGQINLWVRKVYLWMIAVVIGSMIIHNGLMFFRKVWANRRRAGRPIVRMNLSQRIQHAVLLVSFVVLALSGFALKFPESWLALALGSNEAFRSWTHRIAGILLLAVGAFHMVYALGTKDGRKLIRDFWPCKKDFFDVIGNAAYLIGLKSGKPQFARFGYAEKAEYWAVIWGTIIMGVTGLMIWLKMDVTKWMPRWIVDVATTIHYYEAILACLAIVVWHFYHIIFDPTIYPMNWAAIDGGVSKEWQEDEHPLETSGGGDQKPSKTALSAGPKTKAERADFAI